VAGGRAYLRRAGAREAGYAVTFPEAGVGNESVARFASLVIAAAAG
jgi:hypothetical protein